MKPSNYDFLGFTLDPVDRQLRRHGQAVELNARYFDALALLVSEAGTLVTKDRFLEDIWRGVPVTDEALTQCIKTLRRQLGDQVSMPRFIETVPKHGYRFIAPVVASSAPVAAGPAGTASNRRTWHEAMLTVVAGTLGGAFAGLVGGILYGFATGGSPSGAGVGEASAVVVLICLTVVAGLIGGAGVSAGIAVAQVLAASRSATLSALGGAAGGLVVGALARLVALDSFNLLLGRAPTDITGGAEGLALGAAVGLGTYFSLGAQSRPIERAVAPAAVLCGLAGALIPLAGGRMMGGSLDALAREFPGSHLRLGQIGRLFGETGFGPLSQSTTGAIEGLLFGMGVAGAIILGRRSTMFGGPGPS